MTGNIVIGLDLDKSKAEFVTVESDLIWETVSQCAVDTVANTFEALTNLLNQYSPENSLWVFEPTGSYSDKLKQLLLAGGYQFMLINPAESHHFSQLQHIRNKNDACSARLLAMMGIMGKSLGIPLHRGVHPEIAERKRILSVLSGFQKQERMLKNQLHAQQQYYTPLEAVNEALEAAIAVIEQQIKKLKVQLDQLQSPEYLQVRKLVMSVKGVGPVISDWLLSLTGTLEHFESAKQLVSYCGLAPGKHQSGSSVNKKVKVSKRASAMLRGSLFMGAKNAIRFNKACKDLYQRLRARGKTYYQAMVAVMGKLLKQVFGVVKSGIPFDNDYYLQFQKN